MKKFIFYLIFTASIVGIVFYFGWIRVPENSYAVFFSTLTGYDENVLETGQFHFRWQRLIPRNSQTYIISNASRSRNITARGTLPSGNIYSQILQENPDFSYSVSVTATYSISRNFLNNLARSRNIAAFYEAGVDNFFAETDRQIQSALKSYIETRFVILTTAEVEQDMFSPEMLKAAITSSVRNIEMSGLIVTARQLPDINLYRLAARLYREIAEGRRSFLLELELRAAAQEAEFTQRLNALRRYAELLTDHPILLEYFRINPHGDIFNRD
ncbi:MAG: hypothetical protein FWC36_10780 [Spirochaetes bacterium]|nr:hypothetical protein [Spirochaetota bacterium]